MKREGEQEWNQHRATAPHPPGSTRIDELGGGGVGGWVVVVVVVVEWLIFVVHSKGFRLKIKLDNFGITDQSIIYFFPCL